MDFKGAITGDHILFLLKGLLITLEVALVAIVLSFIIGSVIGILRYTKIPVVSQILGVISGSDSKFTATFNYIFTYFALPEAGLKLEIITATIVALTIFEAAMISEIVRSGLLSIEKGQIEAARSSGLTYVQALWHIILPQALRRMVPRLLVSLFHC
ncbi:ABC transporter permease subunit [Bacillus toyonensis]